jgi:hypothetical protein
MITWVVAIVIQKYEFRSLPTCDCIVQYNHQTLLFHLFNNHSRQTWAIKVMASPRFLTLANPHCRPCLCWNMRKSRDCHASQLVLQLILWLLPDRTRKYTMISRRNWGCRSGSLLLSMCVIIQNCRTVCVWKVFRASVPNLVRDMSAT